MIAQAARFGHSFKGAFAYYMHDKRSLDSGPQTAERVGWTETRNLAHDDPAYCQSVMIATARNAERLKAEAGVAATGRKSKGAAVFAYSLSWHPENETLPDRAGMMQAVEASLKALKAEHLQAVIIYHTDEPQKHVHVVLNRADPETGKMHSVNEWQLLRKFREDYERKRGEIVTKTRDERLAEYAQKRRATPVRDFDKAAKPPPAPAQRPEPSPAPKPAPIIQTPPQPAPKSRAAALAEEQAAQRIRHKLEWSQLAAANKDRRSAVYAERIDFKAIAADHRARTKPQWSELGKELAAERKAFRSRETRFSGLVANAVALATIRIGTGWTQERGILSETFRLMLDKNARHAAFAGWEQKEKAKLAATQNTALQERFTAAKAAQAAKLEAVRKTYDTDRAALITRQDLEKVQIRDGWKRIYAERDQLARHAGQSRARVAQQTPQNYRHGRRLDRPTMRLPIGDQVKTPGAAKARISIRADFRQHVPPQQEPQTVKPEFERSAQLPVAKHPAEPMPRMSVATPAPAPSPAGLPVPPARRMDPVPEADRAKAYAATPEGAKATQPQKAAPDALRRSYQPPEQVAPAKDEDRGAAAKPAARDYWNTAATPAPAAEPEQTKPAAKRSYWDKEPMKEKPGTAAPERGKTRDEWERDR